MLWSRLNPALTDWSGKSVWIIGASAGIGAALAGAMAARGARLAISARSRQGLEAVAAGLPGAKVLPMDATRPDDWATAFAELSADWGCPDVVVFCAADHVPQRAWEVTGEQASHTIAINLTSVYRGLEHVIPPMLARASGGIVLVASVAGYMGLPNATVYGPPTKAALINLAEILYGDLHPRGLGVYLINPGFVRTRLTARNGFGMPALQTPEQAASAILAGLARGCFEIDFPRRFTRVLKWASRLPHRCRFALLERLLKLS
jgi:short-subunit dehydrogenase